MDTRAAATSASATSVGEPRLAAGDKWQWVNVATEQFLRATHLGWGLELSQLEAALGLFSQGLDASCRCRFGPELCENDVNRCLWEGFASWRAELQRGCSCRAKLTMSVQPDYFLPRYPTCELPPCKQCANGPRALINSRLARLTAGSLCESFRVLQGSFT